MKATDATLQAILNSPNQYVIPVFQRYYSWDHDNWESLWTNILELRDPDQPSQSHFMGSLVFVPLPPMPTKQPAYQVIDGQQRIITMSLTLCALRDVAKAAECNGLADEITNTALLHPYKHDVERFRVNPRQRDRAQYIAVLDGKPATGRIDEARAYFTQRIWDYLNEGANGDAGVESRLREMFTTLMSQLEFVNITLEGENPYRIFRSLNSTGVDLTEGDLIRNFMFMHVPIEDQDEFDDERWRPLERRFQRADRRLDAVALTAFFRDFLMRTGQYVTPAATFQTFEKRYSTSNGDFSADKLAEELIRYTDFYDYVRGAASHPNPSVQQGLQMLRDLETTTSNPLTLALFERHAQGSLSLDDLAQCLQQLASFVLRRYICGEQSRSYGRWFALACQSLGDNPVEKLSAYLESRGFPDDRRFATQFAQFSLYSRSYCRPILIALEKSIPDKEPALLDKATIEHIMPQTLTPEWRTMLGSEAEAVQSQWLNTIGNLTLTAYNSELQNKPFPEKRAEYATSNINLTKHVATYTVWTESEIQARGIQLAQRATTIWRGPTIPQGNTP